MRFTHSRLVPFTVLLMALFPVSAIGQATTPPDLTRVNGVAIDGTLSTPLADVLISAEGAAAVVTGPDGRFSFDLPRGRHTISASSVRYAFTRRVIDVGDQPVMVTIQMVEGVGFEDAVVVTASPRVAETPGAEVLTSGDLQNLRGVLMDDPLRAAQSLPAATASDDLYGEFSIRGNPFRYVGLSIDGIPSPYLLHTVHGITDAGSITMVNSDTLAEASLLPGSFPQQVGRRLGGQIRLATREPGRESVRGRVGLSGTSAAMLVEGPWAGKRGAFLLTARKSYLDYLIARFDPSATFVFGFTDAQGLAVFDLSPKHRIQFLAVTGVAGFSEDHRDQIASSEEAQADSFTWLAALSWRYSPTSKLSLSQRVFGTGLRFDNRNPNGAILDGGRSIDLGWRTDGMYAPSSALRIDFGGDAVSYRSRRQHDLRKLVSAPSPRGGYDATAVAWSSYAQVHGQVGPFLSLKPGARVDFWGLSNSVSVSPWATTEIDLGRRVRVLGGGGRYLQFPEFEHVVGVRSGTTLRAEEALHADLGLEASIGDTSVVRISLYARRERDVLWLPDSEPKRLADGAIQLQSDVSRWTNGLNAGARGVEILFRRTSANGISGWIAYALGRHQYTVKDTGETFDSDADQRHGLSFQARYRVSARTSVSSKARIGSNYPLRGYLERIASPSVPPSSLTPPQPGTGVALADYRLSDRRNELRLPMYARMDVRVDRTFTWASKQLTVFAEVANVFNRSNRRNVNYGLDNFGNVFNPTETLLPILPSAGFVLEF